MATRVALFVDYVCPFCFLIEPQVEALKQQRDVWIDIQPFELRPAPTPTLRLEDDYLPRVWAQAVAPYARRVGMGITLPDVSPQPRTAKAFLGLQLAREQGVAEAYSQAMFQAFFQHSRDISQDEVILAVATSVGLDRQAVQEALYSRARQQAHQQALDHAIQDLGITAVPSFRIGQQILAGAQSTAELCRQVDIATRQPGLSTQADR